MIMLIDNYDSFSYNLYQMVGEISPDICVVRNDELKVEEILERKPDRLIISPGPGRPENAGMIMEAARIVGREIPVLGVCLGHQAICAAFGARITYSKRLMHGKQSVARLDTDSQLFKGCSEETPVARYHSLIADPETIPDAFKVIAVTDAGSKTAGTASSRADLEYDPACAEIMGVRHREYPIFGVQFHPESILTPEGRIMLRNFIENI